MKWGSILPEIESIDGWLKLRQADENLSEYRSNPETAPYFI